MTSKKPTAEQLAECMQVLNFMADRAEQAEAPEAESAPEPKPRADQFWQTNSPGITIRTQPGLAMFFTEAGELILRQHNFPKDHFVIITSAFLQQFVEDLHHAMGIKPHLWEPKKQEK